MDLRTRDGCIQYVERSVLPRVGIVFTLRCELPPHGLVFATRMNGEALEEPKVLSVGAAGESPADRRRMMQVIINRTCAFGSVFVRPLVFERSDADPITLAVVQVEHLNFSDVVWTAPIINREIGSSWEGPTDLAACAYGIMPLRFLGNRWMS